MWFLPVFPRCGRRLQSRGFVPFEVVSDSDGSWRGTILELDGKETSTSVVRVELDSKVSGANSFGFFDELMASTASSDGCGMRLS
nr:unnamed protein product [Digitaria exilis]